MIVEDRLSTAALRWRALAKRKLDSLTSLHDGGRWRRYYATEEAFAAEMRKAESIVDEWDEFIRRSNPLQVDGVGDSRN